ncbi:5-deoxy-glucuronate isomerase [Skermania sp. ID1734]|uniref:5-deoxy-glucuronate isomerase n=1 Tax=Skermania sp. ID1734 TaxID=2597516 RepID=UPI00117DB28D|nr:5-deoxy-glucuronate isomerase [Skermania sp. ID1734]TSE00980.1 5-deoxy-glucuronate isomerase [Skermania sp. ID1734]
MSDRRYHLPAGSLATPRFSCVVTPKRAGWSETSLWIIELAPGEAVPLESAEDEIVVLPLRGSAEVSCGAECSVLSGRPSVFAGPTDFAYVGRESAFTVTSAAGGRFAFCGARARKTLPFRYVPASAVAVELRGAGQCSRQVHNFATADTFDADSIIACEVITPAGNWSSYPSHKHDEHTEHESRLEEIYYFEFSDSDNGFGYHRVYGTSQRPIDVLAEVRAGDVVLVPHGYHGPSIATPGYDMYYLNVMAGPDPERAWRITDDPAHGWIRGTWAGQPVDARLPIGRPQ